MKKKKNITVNDIDSKRSLNVMIDHNAEIYIALYTTL